ncbi:MAG: hypothetical protein MUP33_10870 [Polaromonas sp.]|nr:hypothetical protein [Polaromonas sp.]
MLKIILAALLCSAAVAQAAGPLPLKSTNSPLVAPAAAAATHPLAGRWTWTLPDKSCTETLTYSAGTQGTRQGSSGEEITQSRYDVAAIPSLLGFYRLTETVTQSNTTPDCSGDLHAAASEPVTRFVQFSPRKDQLIVCKEESLQACFGPLKRTPG